MRDTVQRMLVIFPFEEDLYREAGIPCTFVGHPLVDLVRPSPDSRAFLEREGLDPERPVVGVLPGSRSKEVRHNLKPLTGAIETLARQRPQLQFLLAVAPSLDVETLRSTLAGVPVRLVAEETQPVLSASSVALVASGTATVEAALLGTPMVVVYRIAPLSYALGRPFVSLENFAMVNLIAGRRVVPELIQRDFTARRVAAEALSLLEDEERAGRMRLDLEEVRRCLGEPGASGRAAEAVMEVLAAAERH